MLKLRVAKHGILYGMNDLLDFLKRTQASGPCGCSEKASNALGTFPYAKEMVKKNIGDNFNAIPSDLKGREQYNLPSEKQ